MLVEKEPKEPQSPSAKLWLIHSFDVLKNKGQKWIRAYLRHDNEMDMKWAANENKRLGWWLLEREGDEDKTTTIVTVFASRAPFHPLTTVHWTTRDLTSRFIYLTELASLWLEFSARKNSSTFQNRSPVSRPSSAHGERQQLYQERRRRCAMNSLASFLFRAKQKSSVRLMHAPLLMKTDVIPSVSWCHRT